MMEFKQERSSQYTNLDDQCLLSEMHRLREDVESTQKWMKELENENESIEYMNKKMAKLAFGFSKEKYEIILKEAQKRGLLIKNI